MVKSIISKQWMATLVAASLFVSMAGPAHGWGRNGHRVTAEIGQRNLDAHAVAVYESLAGGIHLAELATWPDDIRSDRSWNFSQPWHFLSINDDETWEDFEREPDDVGDVLSALEILEEFLSDPTLDTIVLEGKRDPIASPQSKEIGKREALAFYAHLLGDIHQPLHVGRREDQGGNKIGVLWFGEEMSLHKVWDEELIAITHLSYTEMANFLDRSTEQERAEWVGTDYLDWAKESKAVRDVVYDFGKPKRQYYLNVIKLPELGWPYRFIALPVVKDRLRKGGYRLAAKLNAIFANYPL